MLKISLLSVSALILLAGCSGSSENMSKYSVSEPTDYSMNCEALINEIKVIKSKIYTDENLLESFIPNSLLGKEELTEKDMIILSERKKSLQLMYTIKQSKGECRELTVSDSKQESKITKTVKDINNTVQDTVKVFN